MRVLAWLRRGGFPVCASAALLALFYLSAIGAPWVAPYDPSEQNRRLPNAPPSDLRVGLLSGRPLFYTHPVELVDPHSRSYETQRETVVPIRLFARGHLFTTDDGDDKRRPDKLQCTRRRTLH